MIRSINLHAFNVRLDVKIATDKKKIIVWNVIQLQIKKYKMEFALAEMDSIRTRHLKKNSACLATQIARLVLVLLLPIVFHVRSFKIKF